MAEPIESIEEKRELAKQRIRRLLRPTLLDRLREIASFLLDAIPIACVVAILTLLAAPLLLIVGLGFLLYMLIVCVSPRLHWVAASAAAVIIAWMVLERLAP